MVERSFRVTTRDRLSEPTDLVGVVANTKVSTLRESSQPMVYYAFSQITDHGTDDSFALHTPASASALMPSVKTAMTNIDPRLSLNLIPLQQRIENSTRLPRTLPVR